jgi:hypothetical protein
MGKRKKVNFELITNEESEPYQLLDEVRLAFHEELHGAHIALAWRKELKADTDGHLILGKCVKASDLQRELSEWDFVILLNKEVWVNRAFVVEKKKALLDHELCHAAPVFDEEGEPKRDERDRLIWRIRKHDIEEFQGIIERHGCYKSDLERFAAAILKRQGEIFSTAEGTHAAIN